MKKFLLFVLATTLCNTLIAQTRIIYYDKERKGTSSADFATYKRIIPQDLNKKRNPFKDYYITGEVESEGFFSKIDFDDDSKTIFTGEVIHYHKNGKIKSKGAYVNGVLNGTYIEYNEDGICFQHELINGNPSSDYYTVSDGNGRYSKFSYSDNKPIYETPDENNIQTEYIDGQEWKFYSVNNMLVGISIEELRYEVYRFFKVWVLVKNESFQSIEFNPENSTATLLNKKGELETMSIWPYEEFYKKATIMKGLSNAFTNFGNSLSTNDAGKNKITTTDANGRTITTTTYTDKTAQAIAKENARYEANMRAEALAEEQQSISKEYLKRSTISPGDKIYGYVMVDRKKGTNLTLNIERQWNYLSVFV